LVPELTAKENVSLPLLLRGIPPEKAFQKAEETLRKAYKIIQLAKPINKSVLSDYYKIKGDLVSNKSVFTKNLESFKREKKQSH
jgi:hypothetical protein